jgi:hypothetical protein
MVREVNVTPTPNVNSHLMQLRYTIDALTHKMQFHVEAVYESSEWRLIGHDDTHTDWKDVVDAFDDVLGGIMPVGTTPAGATLFQWSSGSLVPVEAYGYALSPGADAVQVGFGEVYYCRDAAMKAMKVNALSEHISACLKATSLGGVAALSVAAGAFAAELMNDASDGFGNFWRSLAGGKATTFISWVTDSNEKLRRIRGVK